MLHKILHNPIYYGRVRIEKWGLDTQGDFEPLIDEETFGRAQLHLSETRRPVTAYRRNHPDFPLRRFVACGVCGHPLTGGWSRGKVASYPYYNCTRCKGINVRKAVLEEQFVQLLDRLRPKAEVLKLLSAAVLDRWHEGVRIIAGVAVGGFVLQVIIGLVVMIGGESPADGLHLLYGVGLVAVVPLALSFASDAPRRARSGVLVVAGLVALLLAWRLLVTG